MKTCKHCQKDNPEYFAYCRYCGADIREAPMQKHNRLSASFWKRLPAWVWIIIIVVAIGGGIMAIIGSFIALATVEGVASIVLLILGVIGFGVAPLRAPGNTSKLARGIGLSFFALMGASVDQPGNFIYNKPVESFMCPAGSGLERDENISHPVPGSTYITQDFTCYDAEGAIVKEIHPMSVAGVRFIEYVIIGYLLLALRSLIWRVKNNTR